MRLEHASRHLVTRGTFKSLVVDHIVIFLIFFLFSFGFRDAETAVLHLFLELSDALVSPLVTRAGEYLSARGGCLADGRQSILLSLLINHSAGKMASYSAVAIMGFGISATIWHRELVVTLFIVFVLVSHHDLGFCRLHGQLRWLVKHGGADGLRHLVYQVSHIGIHLHL